MKLAHLQSHIPLRPDINTYAKFEEIRQKILKLEPGNDALTDGLTSTSNARISPGLGSN